MVYSYWVIEREERLGDGVWSSTVETLSDVFDPVIRTNLGDGKDTFEFKLSNFDDRYSGQSLEGGNGFNIGDKITIYYAVNKNSVVSSDLLMTGIINDIPYDVDATKNFIRVKGNNYSESLMNALVFYTPSGSGDKLNDFLEGAINSIGLFHKDFKVVWDDDNPDKKRDGVTDFPVVYDKWFYKSALKLIEEYSADNATEDGNYYWYVSRDNKLVWRPKTNEVSSSFDSSVDEYKALKVKKDLKGVVNFVIAKGGVDPKGKAISVKWDDLTSRSKHGFKYKLITLSATKDNDLTEQDYFYGAGLDTNEQISSSNYPTTTGWEATTTRTSSPAMTPGSKVSCSSWGDYVTAYRDEIKARLRSQAQDYVNAHRFGKLQVELEFVNGKGWGIGDVVSISLPEINAVKKLMRVSSAEYTKESERFVLEEDEGTL